MSFKIDLIRWYKNSYRELPWRRTTDPYLIWLSEIMLQQTRVEQGLPYYLSFSAQFPNVHALANASEDEVLKQWQGLGYYSRARNLHATAKYISEERNGSFPNTYIELIKLKGIGAYTAAAIASFAFGEACPVIDGNVERFLSRYLGINKDIKSKDGREELKNALLELFHYKQPALFNQAIMEFGSQICTPKQAKCAECIFRLECEAYKQDKVYAYPYKKSRTKVKEIHHSYLVMLNENKVWIEQRKEGIWKNMYQFPLIEDYLQTDRLEEQLEPYFIAEGSLQINLDYSCVHLLSHRKINAHFYRLEGRKPIKTSKNHIFEIELNDLQNNYPVSVLISKYLEHLTKHGK